jgi:hypothetical protein
MDDEKVSGFEVVVGEMYSDILVGHVMCNKKESGFAVVIGEICSGIRMRQVQWGTKPYASWIESVRDDRIRSISGKNHGARS